MLRALLIIAKYIPEVIELVKLLINTVDKQIEQHQIKKGIKEIREAVKEEDKAKGARALNNLFKGE